ncbi:uncharacterized protein LOC110404746 isoform X2 [Numida meleagris]|nr:uncharacterized protein LOC110404746 isoform X2 [Numida meleagris]
MTACPLAEAVSLSWRCPAAQTWCLGAAACNVSIHLLWNYLGLALPSVFLVTLSSSAYRSGGRSSVSAAGTSQADVPRPALRTNFAAGLGCATAMPWGQAQPLSPAELFPPSQGRLVAGPAPFRGRGNSGPCLPRSRPYGGLPPGPHPRLFRPRSLCRPPPALPPRVSPVLPFGASRPHSRCSCGGGGLGAVRSGAEAGSRHSPRPRAGGAACGEAACSCPRERWALRPPREVCLGNSALFRNRTSSCGAKFASRALRSCTEMEILTINSVARFLCFFLSAPLVVACIITVVAYIITEVRIPTSFELQCSCNYVPIDVSCYIKCFNSINTLWLWLQIWI